MKRHPEITDTAPSSEVAAIAPSPEQQIIDLFNEDPELAALSFGLVKNDQERDLQAKKIEELRSTRQKLLEELYDGSFAGEVLASVDDPAMYLKETIGGFAKLSEIRFDENAGSEGLMRGRSVITEHGSKLASRFATLKREKHDDGSTSIVRDLDMHIQYRKDRGHEVPERWVVAAEFQTGLDSVPVGYVFSSDGEHYTVERRAYENELEGFHEVGDEDERLLLIQALAIEMLDAERSWRPDDDKLARELAEKAMSV
jgi:hypothetical protein